jgi:hypothetical protein
MERRFKMCDRCGAPIVRDAESEIEISIVSEETGRKEMKNADLCDGCFNSLVKWFGEQNPFTGKMFESR